MKNIDGSLGQGGCSRLGRPLGQVPTLRSRDLAASLEMLLDPWLKKSKWFALLIVFFVWVS